MLIIGHRGARGLAPENTVASLQKAVACGVDAVECDVRVTRDGVAVLCHGTYALDNNGKKCELRNYRFADLKQHIPGLSTLAEAVEAIDGAVPMLIEIKPDEPTGPVVRCLQHYMKQGWRADHFLLVSFSKKSLLKLHTALPTAQIVVNERWLSGRATRRARQLQTTRINLNQRWLSARMVRKLSRQGYQVSAYTLNDPVKVERWRRQGLCGVITDYPDRFSR